MPWVHAALCPRRCCFRQQDHTCRTLQKSGRLYPHAVRWLIRFQRAFSQRAFQTERRLRMLKYLLNLRSKPPLQRGTIRAGIFFLVLLPITALFNYLVGTPAAWSVWTFVEIGAASVLYALVVHYFWDESQSSGSQDQSPPTTRSPR